MRTPRRDAPDRPLGSPPRIRSRCSRTRPTSASPQARAKSRSAGRRKARFSADAHATQTELTATLGQQPGAQSRMSSCDPGPMAPTPPRTSPASSRATTSACPTVRCSRSTPMPSSARAPRSMRAAMSARAAYASSGAGFEIGPAIRHDDNVNGIFYFNIGGSLEAQANAKRATYTFDVDLYYHCRLAPDGPARVPAHPRHPGARRQRRHASRRLRHLLRALDRPRSRRRLRRARHRRDHGYRQARDRRHGRQGSSDASRPRTSRRSTVGAYDAAIATMVGPIEVNTRAKRSGYVSLDGDMSIEDRASLTAALPLAAQREAVGERVRRAHPLVDLEDRPRLARGYRRRRARARHPAPRLRCSREHRRRALVLRRARRQRARCDPRSGFAARSTSSTRSRTGSRSRLDCAA